MSFKKTVFPCNMKQKKLNSGVLFFNHAFIGVKINWINVDPFPTELHVAWYDCRALFPETSISSSAISFFIQCFLALCFFWLRTADRWGAWTLCPCILLSLYTPHSISPIQKNPIQGNTWPMWVFHFIVDKSSQAVPGVSNRAHRAIWLIAHMLCFSWR